MELIQAIILGIVQGLTEFLPISSSAHIRILPAIFGWQDPGAAFTANIQLGTLLAVLVYFRDDLKRILNTFVKSITDKELRQTEDGRLGWCVFWGSLPIIIFGFLLKKQIEGNFRSLYVVAGMLIVFGILLALSDRYGKRTRTLADVRILDGIIVGFWQALAIIPGASRSGSTITGGLFAGFDRATAARFSFLLSVPSVFLAALYTLYTDRKELGAITTNLIAGNIASFVVGWACIAFLMNFLQKNSTLGFVLYRIALGLGILVMLASGQLEPFAGIP